MSRMDDAVTRAETDMSGEGGRRGREAMTDPKAEQQGQEWHYGYVVVADTSSTQTPPSRHWAVYEGQELPTRELSLEWLKSHSRFFWVTHEDSAQVACRELTAALQSHDRLVQALKEIRDYSGLSLSRDDDLPDVKDIARAALDAVKPSQPANIAGEGEIP